MYANYRQIITLIIWVVRTIVQVFHGNSSWLCPLFWLSFQTWDWLELINCSCCQTLHCLYPYLKHCEVWLQAQEIFDIHHFYGWVRTSSSMFYPEYVQIFLLQSQALEMYFHIQAWVILDLLLIWLHDFLYIIPCIGSHLYLLDLPKISRIFISNKCSALSSHRDDFESSVSKYCSEIICIIKIIF